MPSNIFTSLQREFRMIHGTCLECGLPGHFAGARKSKGYARIVGLPTSSPTSSSSSSRAVPLAANTAAPTSTSIAPSRCVAAPDYQKRVDEWLTTHSCVAEWLSLRAVLVALRETVKNPNRYLQTSSDAKSKLWLLGTRQQAPKFNEDYKRSDKRHGDNKPFLVRKAFLKRVLMERYRHKL